MANPIQPLDLGAPPTGFVGMNPGVDLCGTRLRNGRKQLPDIFQELHTLDFSDSAGSFRTTFTQLNMRRFRKITNTLRARPAMLLTYQTSLSSRRIEEEDGCLQGSCGVVRR